MFSFNDKIFKLTYIHTDKDLCVISRQFYNSLLRSFATRFNDFWSGARWRGIRRPKSIRDRWRGIFLKRWRIIRILILLVSEVRWLCIWVIMTTYNNLEKNWFYIYFYILILNFFINEFPRKIKTKYQKTKFNSQFAKWS